MNFKIDTREKFAVITPLSENLSDIITEELVSKSKSCLQSNVKNLIINFKNVRFIDEKSLFNLAELNNHFMESEASFVLCELNPDAITIIKENELDDLLNITPTESEAWDIVQMEELERELLNGDDNV